MSQETELIKERLNVVEIVGDYVQLKQVGRHFKGLCPFHQEKTPSFIVSPDKGIWHCFGCQAGGDIFSFIQQSEGLDFPAALTMLAERAGVAVKAGVPARYDPRARQFELHGLAARFYHELLMNQPVGRKAKEYLHGRGVHDETMELFAIGYAPQQWNSVQLFLQSKGFSDREMIDSGLVGKSPRGKLYDRFRGRIMFPIHDLQGRVVAFGGRITPWHATGEEGKYINSPETAIYSKRRVVYNLHRAKHSLHQQPCVVVEGYMDVAMLVQAGVDNVVASSGTAFTSEHVALLQRYTSTLHFAFDADAAGVKAAQAATREASMAGLRVATVLFPSGKDPADVVQENPDRVRAYLDSPTSLVKVLLQRLQETKEGLDREQVLENIVPLVQQTANTVQQGEMIQAIAATLHVPEAAVVARVTKSVPPAPLSSAPLKEPGAAEQDVLLSADQLLLGLVILDSQVRQAVWPQWEEAFFATEQTRALWQALVEQQSQAHFLTSGADGIIDAVPESVRPLAEGLRHVTEEYIAHISTTRLVEAKILVRSLKKHVASRRLRVLRDRLADLSGEERAAALREFQTILKELSTTLS